ncbi:hypothetical protein BDP55DRAFT_634784 [Colletotrichum godetiae]|uniref:Uncharacterized protein n=1 Tax=Colletotrichum godetiae TaxID=1209918 RepID=A0AAJ0AEQ7_9PEZI|nr:uncharacterized protein BDP55DRAFT_634784 [Colletotrichum godetiae]KAK1672514.1 hypothetical protein BDP55DRAFT_634784 [Colletotrichum godetiae]
MTGLRSDRIWLGRRRERLFPFRLDMQEIASDGLLIPRHPTASHLASQSQSHRGSQLLGPCGHRSARPQPIDASQQPHSAVAAAVGRSFWGLLQPLHTLCMHPAVIPSICAPSISVQYRLQAGGHQDQDLHLDQDHSEDQQRAYTASWMHNHSQTEPRSLSRPTYQAAPLLATARCREVRKAGGQPPITRPRPCRPRSTLVFHHTTVPVSMSVRGSSSSGTLHNRPNADKWEARTPYLTLTADASASAAAATCSSTATLRLSYAALPPKLLGSQCYCPAGLTER